MCHVKSSVCAEELSVLHTDNQKIVKTYVAFYKHFCIYCFADDTKNYHGAEL